jgi:flagellar basal body-associated protein FliL
MAEAAKKPDTAAAAKDVGGPGGGDKKDHGSKKDAAGGRGGAAGLLSKTPVLLGIVMILEAVVLFAGFKFLGAGAKSASAIDLAKEAAHAGGDGHGGGDDGHGDGHGGAGKPVDRSGLIEVNVVDFKAPNAQNGRRFIYDTTVFITIKAEFEQRVKDKVKASDALIKDRMRTIIAQMDPEKLGGGSEPGLETLRRQIKTQLEIIIGDGMIDEVLVPRCIPFRADF